MKKREALRILPGLQKRMLVFWMLQAFVLTFLICAVTLCWIVFYTNPTLISYTKAIMRPALAISTVLGFLVSCLAGLFYSRRIAGPVYHIKNTIDEVMAGQPPEPIVLRRHDELKDLVVSINCLLKQFHSLRSAGAGKP